MRTESIDLQNIKDDDGRITVAENLPFEIKRMFMVCIDVGKQRGAHSMKTCDQLFIATMGEMVVAINDENGYKKYFLRKNGRGLLVPARAWRTVRPNTRHAHMLVLASEVYDPDDSIRDYKEFENAIQQYRSSI